MQNVLRFDAKTGHARRADGTSVPLRAQAAQLLAHLAARQGQVVSKDALMDAVWPDTAVTENSLYQCITEIRKALGPDGDKILQTVPRKGYRLMLPEIDAPAPAPRRGLPLMVALAAALVVVGLAIWLLVPRAPALAEAPSIVILPFEASEDDPRWTRIGAGLSAEIAGELARNDWLTVIAPHSAERVGTQNAPEAADRLDVRYVLTGTLQVAGEALRVSAALRDAETDRVLWSARWQGPQDEIFEVQDEMLERIGAALLPGYTGVLVQSGIRLTHGRRTSNLNAFEHYLLGVDAKHRWTPDGYRDSIFHLERAVALDPEFADAWATLAISLHFLAKTVPPAEELPLRQRELAAALTAFDLNPNSGMVRWRIAQVATNFLQDREGGRAHLLRAVELEPTDADTLLIAGWTAPLVGIWGDLPREWSARARVLNPNAPVWYAIGHGTAAFAAGDYEAARDILKAAPPSVTSLFYLALAHVHLDEMDEAHEVKARLRERAPHFAVELQIGPLDAGDRSMDLVVTPAQALGFAMRPPGGLAYLAAR